MTPENESRDAAGPERERRTNRALRLQVQELLTLIREFYHTCHMVAVGQLEPSRAKSKAHALEEQLQSLMADMLEEAGAEEGLSE